MMRAPHAAAPAIFFCGVCRKNRQTPRRSFSKRPAPHFRAAQGACPFCPKPMRRFAPRGASPRATFKRGRKPSIAGRGQIAFARAAEKKEKDGRKGRTDGGERRAEGRADGGEGRSKGANGRRRRAVGRGERTKEKGGRMKGAKAPGECAGAKKCAAAHLSRRFALYAAGNICGEAHPA